jgi:hypothetical protein
MSDSNTLNDVQYDDGNIPRAITRESLLPTPVGPEYDYVLSVFEKIIKDKSAAANFTLAIYKVAQYTATPVLTLIESIADEDEMTLNTKMAFWLNGINSPSTLYGVLNPVLPNFYAGRNILS